jgi:hypothetical protein
LASPSLIQLTVDLRKEFEKINRAETKARGEERGKLNWMKRKISIILDELVLKEEKCRQLSQKFRDLHISRKQIDDELKLHYRKLCLKTFSKVCAF